MSNVPTNLIPTRITGLPEYMGTSTLGYIPYILDGRTYKVQFGQIAAVGAVPSTRVIAAGTGLAGGGDLSENRVISIANGGVGFDQLSATGVVAGSYGSGSEVPVVTVDIKGRITDISTTPLVITGYVPDSRLISTGAGLLGGGSLASNRTLSVDFSSATPQALGSATAGVSNAAARGDHVHPAVNLSDTNQTQGALPLGRGGTGDALSPVAGAVVYSTGTKLALADPGDPGQVFTSNGAGEPYWRTITGTGTVTNVSVLTANGFSGTVAFADTTPQITLSTTVNGMIKGDGLSMLAAAPGVDYVAPSAYISSGLTMATSRLLGRTDAGTGEAQEITVGTGLSLSAGSLVNSAPDQTVTLTGGTAISISGTYPSFTITNTAPDQIVSLTGAGTTTVTGTYPNFTITSNDQYVGTVTSVAASGGSTGLTFSGSPITTSGTLTLGGTLAVASGGTGATTAAGARTNLGAAASGANSDITSLSGITGGIATPDYIDFDTTAAPARATGRLWWDNSDGIQTLNLGMAGSNATLQIGEEMYFRVKASSAITEGQVVMFTGTVGNSGALTGAPATGLTKDTASYVMGVATESIANNGWGYVTQFGLVRNINTTGGAEAWVDGQILYYDPTVPGGLTKNVPTAPAAKVEVAAVVNAASNGSLFVRPIARFSLTQLNDVESAAAVNNDLLQYNGSGGYWQHKSPSTISVGTATNLAGGASGSIPYQSAAGTTTFLASGTGVLAASGGNPAYTMSPSLTQVTVAADPTLALQVATKQYVDTLVASGITYHTPVKYEVPDTTGNLNATYNNGTAGVGATLTNAGTLGAFTPDGTVAQVGDRILIYNQTNAYENGVYTVTTVGSGSVAWVLTRATDANSYALKSPTGLGEGDAFFITSGATGAGETYVCNTTGTITFGTTPITFVQVSSAPVYSAGTGLTLTGTTFSLTSPVATSLGGTGLTSFTSGGAVYATSTSALTTGTLPLTAGGTGATTAAGARTSLGGTTVGSNFFTLTNPSAITFPQINADNTVSALSAAAFRAAIGAGTGGGSVTSVDVSGGTTGLTTSGGPITSSGTITLAGTLNVANGGTGATSLSSGYVLKGNGTSAVSASIIYDNGTNVGVGTSGPDQKFTVNGNAKLWNYGQLQLANGVNTTKWSIYNEGNTGNDRLQIDSAAVSNVLQITQAGSVTATVDMRAPIFYDSDNTAYYLDAASTSNLNTLTVAGNLGIQVSPSYPLQVRRAGGGGSLGVSVDNVYSAGDRSTQYFAIGDATTDNTGHAFYVRSGSATNNLALLINNGSSVTAYGDVRAPIFYDSANTAYYLDPASTSNMADASFGAGTGNNQGISISYGAGSGDYGRIRFYQGGSNNSTIHAFSTAWQGGSFTGYSAGAINLDGANGVTFGPWNAVNMWIDNNGNAQARVSSRAPIFYDSDNTAYYLDPAGTSNLGQINFGDSTKFIRGGASGQIILGAGSASDAYIQVGGSYYPIWNSGNFTPGNYMPISGGTFTGAVGFAGNVYNTVGGAKFFANSGNINYLYAATSGLYVQNATDTANILSLTNGGSLTAGADMRAPIFYDSNDTGYYLDPASTSRLNNLSLNTVAVTSGINGLTSAPITTQYANAGTTNTWYPMTYQRAQYSDGYVTHLNTGLFKNTSDWGSGATGWYAAIGGNDSYPTQAWYLTYDGYIQNSLGYVLTSGSFRAPIFYDSANTGYYLNPNDISNLFTTKFNTASGGATGRTVVIKDETTSEILFGSYPGGWTSALQIQNNDNSDFIWISPLDLNNNARIRTGGCGLDIYTDGGNDTGTHSLFVGSGYAQGISSLRAPYFYDSDNTAYYVDPAGTSNLNVAQAITLRAMSNTPGNYGGISSSWAGNSGYPTLYGDAADRWVMLINPHISYTQNGVNGFTGTMTGSTIRFASDAAATTYWDVGVGTNNLGPDLFGVGRANQWNSYWDGNGNVWSRTSHRAPIYYDSDNTGYYVDPASTSYLNVLNVGSGGVLGSVIIFNNMNNNHGTYQDANSVGDFGFRYLQGPTNGPGISGALQYYGMTVGLGAEYSYSQYGSQFYWPRTPLGGAPYISVRFREGGSWGSWSKIYAGWADAPSGSTFAATGDFRAPVFYDSNDTGYYVDPASTSRLGTLWVSYGQYAGQIYVAGLSPGVALNINHDQVWTYSGNLHLQYSSAGNIDMCYGGGYAFSRTSFRAPIFYDSDNTAYYCNPTGNSVFNTLQASNVVCYPGWPGSPGIDANAYTENAISSFTYGNNAPYTGPFVALPAGGYGLQFNAPYSGGGNGLSFRTRNGDTATFNSWYALAVYGSTRSAGDLYANIYYDAQNSGYYVNPAEMAVLYGLELYGASNKYLYLNPGNGYEAMVRYNGGSGDTWYVGKRMASQLVGTADFHFYSQAYGATVAGVDANGNIFARSSLRAPIFYDLDNTGYYIDPTGDSIINTVYAHNWFRSYGNTGWYNASYGGGIYMFDTTWVRVYNGKSFYSDGDIAAAGNVTAYYSDERLKTKTGGIDNALDKVSSLEGFLYVENDLARSLGYTNKKQQVGVSAQQVQAVLPEAVSLAPVDFETLEDGTIVSKSGEDYLTVDYSRLVPLLIEAIKELKSEVNDLKAKLH